jgi:bacillithiol system protein YtxJ
MIPRLTDEAALETLLATNPAWLFKHSNRCEISAAALSEIAAFAARHPDQRLGMVVVQEQRALSNAIATRLGRVHQTPQLFLLDRGSVIWSASHWSITLAAMERALAGLRSGPERQS